MEAAAEEAVPYSAEALAECVRVIRAIGADMSLLQRPEAKPLRGALHPLIMAQMGKYYGGKDKYEYETNKRLAKEAAGKRNREKQQDENYKNNVQLRKDRLRKLHQLQSDNDQAQLPMIADGPVEAAAPAPEQPAEQPSLNRPRQCYVCKVRFTKL